MQAAYFNKISNWTDKNKEREAKAKAVVQEWERNNNITQPLNLLTPPAALEEKLKQAWMVRNMEVVRGSQCRVSDGSWRRISLSNLRFPWCCIGV